MTNPPLARDVDYGREYRNFLTGEAVPSVTTVLDVIRKEPVEAWKIRQAADYANARWEEMTDWPLSARKDAMVTAHETYTRERSDLGTLVHNILEKIIKGIPVAIPKEASSYVGQFGKFVMDRKPRWIESEATVWSRLMKYAGTLDAFAEIDGQTWLIDFKTSKGVYPEYGLQLAALRYAEFIIREDCSEEPMPPIHKLGVLHLRPRGWKLIPVHHSMRCFTAFCAARDLFEWTHEVADDVLGAAA